jgi:hypothetical protein
MFSHPQQWRNSIAAAAAAALHGWMRRHSTDAQERFVCLTFLHRFALVEMLESNFNRLTIDL